MERSSEEIKKERIDLLLRKQEVEAEIKKINELLEINRLELFEVRLKENKEKLERGKLK